MATKDRRSWLRKALDVITLRDPRNPQYVAVIPNPTRAATMLQTLSAPSPMPMCPTWSWPA